MAGNRAQIKNLTLTLAATEYSFTFDVSDIAAITIQCRQAADIQMAFASGASGTTYFTIPAGTSYTFDIRMVGIEKIFFQSPTAGVVVEALIFY